MNSSNNNFGFYSQLPDSVQSKSGASREVTLDPSTRKYTPQLIKETIETSVSDIRSPQTAYQDRVHGRHLMLTNPFRDDKKQKRKTRHKTKRKALTARQKRQMKIYQIPKECQRYELFLPLHQMWSSYINKLMTGGQQLNLTRLLKADFHGSRLEVVRSRCPNYVGIGGIVVEESKNGLRIITREDCLVLVPKAHSVFEMELPNGAKCLLYGGQIRFRASERATKKFKPKPTVDL